MCVCQRISYFIHVHLKKDADPERARESKLNHTHTQLKNIWKIIENLLHCPDTFYIYDP